MGRRLARGLLIVFEGIDGAGKTTQAVLLAEALERQGLTVVRSKEPTDGPWGRRLRQSAATGRLSAEEELETFIKDRQEHVRELIAPALAAGTVVILDRYYFSTAAYQGARGMDAAAILAANEAFAPAPDALFLLQVPPRLGLDRIAARGDVANLFEREDNLLQCARIFDAIDRPFIHRIDGTRDPQAIHAEILATVAPG